jgi:hypothetical protein
MKSKSFRENHEILLQYKVSSNPNETVLTHYPKLNFKRSFEAKSCKTTSFHLFLFNTHAGLISWLVKKLSFSQSLLATRSVRVH